MNIQCPTCPPFFSVCFAPLLVGPHRRHRFHGSSKVDNARLSMPPPLGTGPRPRPRPNLVPRLKHVQRLRWRSGRWKFLTRKCCISHIWRLKMNGLSQLCIEKKWWNCLVSKNAQKKLGRRLVESDFCAEHEDKTSRRLPRVADGQDTFWKKRTEVQNT